LALWPYRFLFFARIFSCFEKNPIMSELQYLSSTQEDELRLNEPESQEGRGWQCDVDRLLGRIAPSDMPVLIQGETGAGKEVIARRIHEPCLRS
jgi:DNA-binding NtrC family response regulator